MIWRQGSDIVTLPFMPPPVGVSFTYEVYVTNDPLFDPNAFSPVVSPHDELAEYYRVLPGVRPQERFTLTQLPVTASPESPSGDRGSPRIPCMPVIGEG
jgi:hypothetical protein